MRMVFTWFLIHTTTSNMGSDRTNKGRGKVNGTGDSPGTTGVTFQHKGRHGPCGSETETTTMLVLSSRCRTEELREDTQSSYLDSIKVSRRLNSQAYVL